MASNFSVELFKVPFDNSYKKVFDIDKKVVLLGYDYEKTFHDYVLSIKYESIDILQPTISNIKRYNNNIIFTLKQNYFDIRNFNYISLKYNNKYYFYFITNIVSENDNPVNPSVTITGEWDAWHNHLTDIYFHKTTNIENVIQSHKTRNEIGENGEIKRYFYKQNINKISTSKIPYNNDKPKVLFMKMVVDENFYKLLNVEYNIGGTTFSSGDTGLQTSSTIIALKNVLYIPIGVRTDIRNNYIRTDIPFKTYHNGYIYYNDNPISMPQITVTQNFNINELQIKEQYAPYIISAEFTYNSPVKYEWAKDGSIEFYCVGGKSETIFNSFGISIGLPEMLCLTVPTTFTYDGSKRITTGWAINRDIDSIILNSNNLLPNNSVTTNINENDNINDEIALYNYPFKYYSLYYNNNEIPIENKYKQPSPTETTIAFDNSTNQTNFKILVDIPQLNNGNIFLKSNGFLTLSKDALQDYLIRNGSQEKTALLMKSLTNLPNFLSYRTMFTGMTNTFNNLFSVMSKHADLQTTPDAVSLSDRGEDDLYIQDDLIIYINTIKDNDILKDYYKYYYIYGYAYPENIEILDNTRFWFDYKQTQNCKLNNPINLTDKQRIERMFDDGVHMFHINYDENNENVIVNSSMEFNGKNNIERSIATI